MAGLFGEEFDIKLDQPKKVKDLLKKTKKVNTEEVEDVEKVLKDKKVDLLDKLALIKTKVLKVLGKQKNNILVIKDLDTFSNYIEKAIKFGRISVDTETNNSLDPVTCKIMGLCLYVNGEKQAYIPINHRDPITKARLSWQLTEEDCKNQLQKVINANLAIIMHNGKFDYEVIKCTCGIEVKPTWDTLICARLLNENDLAGLKYLYRKFIDPTQEKYDIESLFENISYADIDPEIFAYYAATDAFMTDKLYEVQYEEMQKDEYGPHLDLLGKHEVKGLRWLFHEVEMPIVVITAEMELTGVAVDREYGARLKLKYDNELKNVDNEISNILERVNDIIINWKLSKEANEKTKNYVAKKSKMTLEKIEKMYPEIDEAGNRFKYGKAKVDQLASPINLASPTQLAILLFDILKAPIKDKDSRATGEDELQEILDKTKKQIEEAKQKNKLPKLETLAVNLLCDLILKRRGIVKLLTTYIEVIPELVKHWPDGRIRFHLNQLGTDTGRFSSGGKLKFMENDEPITVSGINIQNIPSHSPEIRSLFRAAVVNHTVELTDNYYLVPETDEVETIDGWKYCKDLTEQDKLFVDNQNVAIQHLEYNKQNKEYLIYVEEVMLNE